MKSKILHLIVLSIILIGLSSCEKKGCTHYLATNYDASIKTDDGSCEFETKAVFYISAPGGGGNVSVKVDGQEVGVIKRYSRNGENACAKGRYVTWKAPEGTYTYEAVQENSGEPWSNTFYISKSNCSIVNIKHEAAYNLPKEGGLEYNIDTRIDSSLKPHVNEIRIINNCDVNYLFDIKGSVETGMFLEEGTEQSTTAIPKGKYFITIRYHDSSKVGTEGSCNCATHHETIGPFLLNGQKLTIELKEQE